MQNLPNFPKVPIDRVRILNGPQWPSAIPELRKQHHGRVPLHGTLDDTTPTLSKVAIVVKRVCFSLNYYGRWP